MSHDASNLSPTLTPALEHRSSSSSAQYITLPNSPSSSSSNQGTPSNNNKLLPTPLNPPPPSIQDDETAQEVDLALAKRHSKPWAKLSPISPFQSPSKRKGDDEDEEIETRQRPEIARQSTMNRLIRPAHTRNETGSATIASIKLDGLIRKGTIAGEKEEKILYKYAYVYENQRGFARFRTLKFSSRALKIFFHYRDPAAFTKYEEEEGKVEEIDLPYASLVDVQLPSPEWAWHGAEWLIDMAGDGMTSYDGFQYSTSFHSGTWRPHPPSWHSYFLTCCRRRRWLRLMVYLPSFISPDSAGNFCQPGHIPEASEPPSPLPPNSSTANLDKKNGEDSSSNNSPRLKSPLMPRHEPVDLNDIWHSVPSDWTRVHAALKTVKSDGRRLELWKVWLGDEEEVEEDITGLGRISLERRRKEEEKGSTFGRGSRDGKKSLEKDGKKSLEKDKKGKKSILAKVKGNNNKRGVQWTEDNDEDGPHAWKESGGATISYLMTDEPLPLEGQRAPREAIASVLRNHAEEILASFIYPDSRAKFHDMLLRTGLLDNLPSGLSWSIATDFRERLEL